MENGRRADTKGNGLAPKLRLFRLIFLVAKKFLFSERDNLVRLSFYVSKTPRILEIFGMELEEISSLKPSAALKIILDVVEDIMEYFFYCYPLPPPVPPSALPPSSPLPFHPVLHPSLSHLPSFYQPRFPSSSLPLPSSPPSPSPLQASTFSK
jgi:hypothetical protein